MNKNFETQLKEIAEFNIPDNKNIWPSLKESINYPKRKVKSRPKINLLRPALIALTLMFAISNIPSVHAKLEEIIESIGGVFFNITTDYPDSPVAFTSYGELFPVEQISTQYSIDLPLYKPIGFELESDAKLFSSDNYETHPVILLKWDDGISGTGHIFLSISQPGTGSEPVAPGSLETILINGLEVALISGGWYQNTGEWSFDINVWRLKWEKDDLLYSLSFYDIDLMDEMIQMVASIIE